MVCGFNSHPSMGHPRRSPSAAASAPCGTSAAPRRRPRPSEWRGLGEFFPRKTEDRRIFDDFCEDFCWSCLMFKGFCWCSNPRDLVDLHGGMMIFKYLRDWFQCPSFSWLYWLNENEGIWEPWALPWYMSDERLTTKELMNFTNVQSNFPIAQVHANYKNCVVVSFIILPS